MRGVWQSKEAVLVVEKILRFVNLVGGHVPWSNAQRKALGPHFDADARHFGSGCFFYSAAPDDVAHALAQRMCFAHDGSGRFPAVKGGHARPPRRLCRRAPRSGGRVGCS